MYFSTVLVALLSVGAVLSTTHNIMVGQNGTLTFSPDHLDASIGDILDFLFVDGNHTITQSTFDTPCDVLTAPDGVDSGFKPGTPSDPVSFSFAINETSAPLWFYCRHPGHCQQGMVFAVNAPTTGNNTFQAFQSIAKAGDAISTATSLSATSTLSRTLSTLSSSSTSNASSFPSPSSSSTLLSSTTSSSSTSTPSTSLVSSSLSSSTSSDLSTSSSSSSSSSSRTSVLTSSSPTSPSLTPANTTAPASGEVALRAGLGTALSGFALVAVLALWE